MGEIDHYRKALAAVRSVCHRHFRGDQTRRTQERQYAGLMRYAAEGAA